MPNAVALCIGAMILGIVAGVLSFPLGAGGAALYIAGASAGVFLSAIYVMVADVDE